MTSLVFGAFDRHNFGDLLFPHIVENMLPGQEIIFTGLLERDLSNHGGHHVRALAGLAEILRDQPVDLIHAGGELLTCEAWQAAVMLLPIDEAERAISRLATHPQERQPWARSVLGMTALAPYSISRNLFPHAASIIYNGVGGVDIDHCTPAMRAEVIDNLRAATAVSVRDQTTLTHLQHAGLTASLIPDPAVMTAELFGENIRIRAHETELSHILETFAQGYLAVQCSADFGDPDTLATLAAQLDAVALDTGYGICFFRAGTAPWHDDLAIYQRIAARMHAPSVQIFKSTNLWDICALIAYSRGYCGSSLHGRIVATSFALPHINILHPRQQHSITKQAAYAATWETVDPSLTTEIHKLADSLREVLQTNPEQLHRTASELVKLFQSSTPLKVLARR